MSASLPAGFHPHASGLIVPEAHARARRVTTKDEWRTIERALKILGRLGVATAFRCQRPTCTTLQKLPTPDGGTILRCDCADRVFTKAY